jgi:hypothetical protein
MRQLCQAAASETASGAADGIELNYLFLFYPPQAMGWCPNPGACFPYLFCFQRYGIAQSWASRSNASRFAGHREVKGAIMIDPADKRGEIIKHLEDAMAIADELEDGATGYLIERALDMARAQYFRLPNS